MIGASPGIRYLASRGDAPDHANQKPSSTMSRDQEINWEKQIKRLGWVVKLGWALIAGAFGIGVLVTKLQIKQFEFEKENADLRHSMSLMNDTINNPKDGHEKRLILLEYDRAFTMEQLKDANKKLDILTQEIRSANKTASSK